MIRLSKLTDYGILLMTQIARHPERPMYTARDLSAETQLPLPTVSKILKALSNGGLLCSHRGVKGGYSLTRNAQEISVGQVITVLEGPIGVTECGGMPGLCDLEPHCPMSANWRIISNEVKRALENLTLPDLISPVTVIPKSNELISIMESAPRSTQYRAGVDAPATAGLETGATT
ncbi:MAG: SUF system Fe-S cluster assembly regulator [Terriglobales bacterium]|jgi:FeS assembly SUF system regulator